MNESGKMGPVTVSFTGTALPLFGRGLLLMIAQLLVIPTPWAAADFYRWIIEHLSLSDGTRASFKGKGGDIWYVLMLVVLSGYAYLIPIPFLPLLLLPITSLLWITIIRWFVRSVSLSSGTRFSFSGTYWQYLGWSVLITVSGFTIIGWAWVMESMVRWFFRNFQSRNHYVEFTGSGSQILWRTIVTALACVAVIPIPWVMLWFVKWYISNIRIYVFCFSGKYILEIDHVAKNYASPGSEESVCVLKDIDLRIEKGKSLVIVGPSGSGKSTLLNIIGALDQSTQGRVLFGGQDLAGLKDTVLARIRNKHIGFVFQLHHLLPQCTVLENVLIPTLDDNERSSAKELRERATNLLERVGLKEFLLYRPGELSGGQRQRVAVVRALINNPKLLLADEPTGSLDKESSENIADLLVELNRSEKVTLVVVTHSLSLAERMGRVMELSDGLLKDRSRQ